MQTKKRYQQIKPQQIRIAITDRVLFATIGAAAAKYFKHKALLHAGLT